MITSKHADNAPGGLFLTVPKKNNSDRLRRSPISTDQSLLNEASSHIDSLHPDPQRPATLLNKPWIKAVLFQFFSEAVR